jgi:putative tricarboxylic transport membrane protein
MPPLILAFVLGGLMEENLRRSLLLSNGSWEFLWDRTLNSLYISYNNFNCCLAYL